MQSVCTCILRDRSGAGYYYAVPGMAHSPCSHRDCGGAARRRAPGDAARRRPARAAHRRELAPRARAAAEKARGGIIGVYFAGDSITRRWGATDYPDLLAHWRQTFFGWNAANFGWGGDTTQNIRWRLENGELDGVNAGSPMGDARCGCDGDGLHPTLKGYQAWTDGSHRCCELLGPVRRRSGAPKVIQQPPRVNRSSSALCTPRRREAANCRPPSPDGPP